VASSAPRPAACVALGWAAAAAALLPARPARAEPIVDRDYAIELHDGVALGDATHVGMGGTGAAHALGSAGALMNPAAPAVRRTTDGDRWSWDYHLDLLTGRFSTDYDNNGAVADASGALLVTAGIAVRVGRWAGAVTLTTQSTPVAGATLAAEAIRGRVVLARHIDRLDLAVGVGAQTMSFQLAQPAVDEPLFEISASGLIAGATWVPRGAAGRVGLALETPVLGGAVETASCDPESCRGYILPRQVEAPARAIAGAAYRLAATPWNVAVSTPFRDERALVIAGDVVITGRTRDGHGLEAFGMGELQRAGRAAAVSVRGGAEWEWLPGRLRLRGGAYWEPGRFDGVAGRLHGTVGADLRVLAFRAWGPRRGRISVTADVASRYRNLAASIGLWR
jgi:hypothetical protein